MTLRLCAWYTSPSAVVIGYPCLPFIGPSMCPTLPCFLSFGLDMLIRTLSAFVGSCPHALSSRSE